MKNHLLKRAPVALAMPLLVVLDAGAASAQTWRPENSYGNQPCCGPSAMPRYVPAVQQPAAYDPNRRALDYSPRQGVTYRNQVAGAESSRGLGRQVPAPYYAAPPPHAFEMPAMWTGAYIGAHGGYGWGRTRADHADLGRVDPKGGLAGLHAGYNWQNGKTVYGLEGDLTGSWMNDGATFASSGLTLKAHPLWMATMRGRLGYAPTSNLLFYATGGLALSGQDLTVSDAVDTARRRNTQIGYVAGAGIEFKLNPATSLRLEGLHYGFAERNWNFGGADVPVKSDHSVVRAGVSFHLN